MLRLTAQSSRPVYSITITNVIMVAATRQVIDFTRVLLCDSWVVMGITSRGFNWSIIQNLKINALELGMGSIHIFICFDVFSGLKIGMQKNL